MICVVNKYTFIHTWRGPTFGVGGGVLKDTTYLRTLATTFYWLLNLSWHRNIQLARDGITRQTRKVRFKSHCNFLLLDRGVAMQWRHHVLTLSKGGAGRHHQLFYGLDWVLFECSRFDHFPKVVFFSGTEARSLQYYQESEVIHFFKTAKQTEKHL